MLNVHCGVGCGSLVGLHVGDTVGSEDQLLETRREFLFLGDPIDQVSRAEGKASQGEVFASSEVIQVLKQTCQIPSELLDTDEPACIAARKTTFFVPIDKSKPRLTIAATKDTTAIYCESLMHKCADMDAAMLAKTSSAALPLCPPCGSRRRTRCHDLSPWYRFDSFEGHVARSTPSRSRATIGVYDVHQCQH
jgi:hypothetical protein